MPVFFCCIIVFIIWLQYENRKSNLFNKKQSDVFWIKEREAAFTRKTDISNLKYIHIPLETLPFSSSPDEKLLKFENEIKKLSTKKIYNLTGYSNTDIKLEFGVPNFEDLASYDQNYTKLICTISNWGCYLYELNCIKEAQTVLELGIQYKTDISKNFITLAKIYQSQNDFNALKQLLEQAKQLDVLTKSKVIETLTTIMNTLYMESD